MIDAHENTDGHGRPVTDPVIRTLVDSDRPAVLDILTRAGNFSQEEINVAMELVDEWLVDGEASGYLTHVVEESDADARTVRGYVCVGPAPMTHGTFDLYWIAVDPDAQGRGFGALLLAAAEQEVQARRGHLLLIETASQTSYGAAVRFYERSGYRLVSRIEDYYRTGDDKLTFAKRLRES